ncbi:MAG: bifunctional [glutamate--ammonia ligase]-adenylyl-L-tyrosine phosphorylase/[glutamate--ammonia-ligase] adenylyltransferase [Halieaceae bacterium]|jgi:glutamate-ammonia-ligase adenylyltransferase|nr:bifunctional [glutamate--ammonia ligase]-adenylyl-L-tyrosine phosphorylase/[glutamate--ammonia-ligase] adenylyltransferase [Halieaceae bacterium]
MALPESLHDQLDSAWSGIERRAGEAAVTQLRQALDNAGLAAEFEQLLACSTFFAEQVAREFDWVLAELNAETLLAGRDWDAEDWLDSVNAATADAGDEKQYMAALRRFRQRQMLRLVWRDFTRRAALESTLVDVSALADACIRSTVAFATAQLAPRWGQPIGAESGRVQPLVVLAMGKLGASELNLSSDIDLIFAYPEGGHTEGGRSSTSNQEYFIRLGQTVIRLLDAHTADGFVFRVDMRLRPYGDSGALVGSYAALELYYQEQGREWERYAMIKARPVTGEAVDVQPLHQMIRAFVYRRYTDFSVVESLREMKAMISAETRRLNLGDDIKRGSGGIREIEFIVQSLQLIHGGRIPELRHRELNVVLDQLVAADLFPVAAVSELRSAYRFLRNLEHALQGMADQQTQTLPGEPLARLKLALIMGLPDWATLEAQLTAHRTVVANHFASLVAVPDEHSDQPEALTFAGLDQQSMTALGFADAAGSWGELQALLVSSRVQAVAGEGRVRLERFLPRLVEAAGAAIDPDRALRACLPFVAAVCRRSAYLVLLEENPQALASLVDLAGRSSWLADKLAARPELVDELLYPERLHSAPDRSEMRSLVQQQLLRVPEDDLEEQMAALGRIKDAVVLRVAASELLGELPTMKVSDNLTFLAEVLVEQAIHIARVELVRRHGEPQAEGAGFAVMGYGKLGGIELSYGSDLDLVFVYDGADGQTAGPRMIDNARFYTRLAQRVVHVLSTTMLAGRLYEVDLRLRPNGDSGLVATTLAALKKYQLESAWTWEHQALVRARPIAGDAHLLDALTALRGEVIAAPRDTEVLAEDVVKMRLKMLQQSAQRRVANDDEFDLKLAPGGIVDIEFVVQYLVLAHAAQHPEIGQWSDVVRILESLERAGLMPADDADALRAAYLAFRGEVHLCALQDRAATADAKLMATYRQTVQRIRDNYLKGLSEWQ